RRGGGRGPPGPRRSRRAGWHERGHGRSDAHRALGQRAGRLPAAPSRGVAARQATMRAGARTPAAWMPLARVVGLAGALLLVACGHSPSTQFYLLGAVRASPPLAHFAGSPVQLRAVHVPAVLDRVELVSALPGGRLQIDQFRQWGAPMEDMIRNVLSQDLTARLPAGMVAPTQAPAPRGSRGIVVDVLEFQPESGTHVVLNAAWTLLGTGPAHPPRYERRRFERSGVGAEASDRVQAMSELLGRL